MGDSIRFRTDPLERQLIQRAAERQGVTVSELIRRSVARDIGTGPLGRLDLTISPRLAEDLLNAAARLGTEPGIVVEALIRDHLHEVTEERIDPEAFQDWVRRRAKELLSV